jgi:signal peptidase I
LTDSTDKLDHRGDDMVNAVRIRRRATSRSSRSATALAICTLIAAGLIGGCVNVTVMAPAATTTAATTTGADPLAGCDSPRNGSRIYRVEQQSMEPMLVPDDELLIVPVTTIAPGEIVIFNPPPAWVEGTAGTPFIKRVIGVPDEVIVVKDGKVWVNGTALMEPYLYGNQPTTAQAEPATWTIGPGQFFLMGDHRAASADSRSFGPVGSDLILGRAVAICAPVARRGQIAP